ncbi:MAG TPA: cell wall metabolism sensor histidine kinase WalK, partial [Firmicutes bacterium]|nr:cell wall metabolism sensor histidine kinase WalK [Bacillota bacterium]
IEKYHLNNHMESIEAQGNLLAGLLQRHLMGELDEEDIFPLIKEFSIRSGTEITLLDSHGRVITGSGENSFIPGQRIFQDEVSRALSGITGEAIRYNSQLQERYRFLALPIKKGNDVLGVLYVISSLGAVDQTVSQVKRIFMTVASFVLILTVILGFILAKSITKPIQAVTARAAQMAGGDFEQRIEVKSTDEIGQLGNMFNYLAAKLRDTLKEIAAEKGKVEGILNYMNDGVVAINQQGEIIQLNPAAKKILGGNSIFSLFPRHELMTMLLAEGQETRELVLTGPPQRYIKAHIAPFRADQGNLLGLLVVLQDITSEQELKRNRQEFVTNVSHELKTPLTTIKSYVETLLNGAMENKETCFTFLNVVASETDRMVRLVKDLLVLSRLDYRQLRWHLEEGNLEEILRETARDIQFSFSQTNSPVLEINIPVLPAVTIDRDKVKQVLSNILSNAFKYTPGDGKITLTAFPEKREIVICVKDTGPGIPPDDTERVFERFYRVDKARSRQLGGTGLGLAIAKKLVEAHGGRIWLESRLNQGTSVFFTLPRETGEERGGVL